MTLVKPVLLLELYLSQGDCRALTIDLCISGIDRARYSLSFALRGSERYRIGNRKWCWHKKTNADKRQRKSCLVTKQEITPWPTNVLI